MMPTASLSVSCLSCAVLVTVPVLRPNREHRVLFLLACMLIVFAGVSTIIAVVLVSLIARVADVETQRDRVPALARSASFFPALMRAVALQAENLTSMGARLCSLTRMVDFGFRALTRAVMCLSRRNTRAERMIVNVSRRVSTLRDELSDLRRQVFEGVARRVSTLHDELSDLRRLVSEGYDLLNERVTIGAFVQLREIVWGVLHSFAELKERAERAFLVLAMLGNSVALLGPALEQLQARVDRIEALGAEDAQAVQWVVGVVNRHDSEIGALQVEVATVHDIAVTAYNDAHEELD